MKIINVIGAGVATLACAAVLTLPAAAATPTTYTTTLTETLPTPTVGEFDGKLQLTISPDGVISGYYVPEYDGDFTPVTGGIQDGNYWLDIGGGVSSLHVTGRVAADGSLIGTATTTPDTRTDAQPFTDTYAFVAKPQS